MGYTLKLFDMRMFLGSWLLNLRQLKGELSTRYGAKSPIFWQKVKRFFASIGTICAGVLIMNATFDMYLDEWFLKGVSYLLCVCGGVVGVSVFTVESKEVVIRDKESECEHTEGSGASL